MPTLRPASAVLLLLTLLGAAGTSTAQDLPQVPPRGGCRSEMDARLAFGLCPDSTFDFYASGAYRSDIPHPDSVFGYPLGSWHTTYGRMERWVEALARSAPDRVRVFPYGRSIEHQPMYLVAVGSEANIARLDTIRADLGRLADPRRTGRTEANAIIARLPIVVWINSANDGNETAAFEAAIQVAYQMAAGDDVRTRELRNGALVLVNLAHNPESHERMVAWYNGFVMGDADPRALEHRPPWGMSTNNNHYQFDLNRDALGLTQTESRAVAAELQRWRPQLFVDLHGQTTQYFFPPAADPISPVYPAQLERWLQTFGRGNAAAFDQYGWSYYTRDVFDLFYPGYWDTYPSLHGATGMTYETDGGGNKGVRWRRDDGTILTFADGIAKHFVASLATIETAVQNREARLRDYYDFFATGLEEGARGTYRQVILLPGDDPTRAERLAATLLRHGIETQRVVRGGMVSGTDYLSGERVRRAVPVGAYLVDLRQPNGRLARTLLARETPLPERFVQQELARRARNARRAEDEQEGHAFYDVTAWSLPLIMGVDAIGLNGSSGLATEPAALPAGAAKAPGGWEGDHPWPSSGGVTARARSAYVWAPGSMGATRLAARLLDEGFNVVVSEQPPVVADSAFPRGTWIARVGRNRAELHARIDALAREAGVRVFAAETAFPERGASGIGGEATRTLRAPRVAVLSGEGVDPTSYGALWFHLERRVGYPFTALRASQVASVRLDDWDVIVLPNGRFGTEIGENGAKRLRDWAERGGTLIGYAGGAEYLQDAPFAQASQDSAAGRAPKGDSLAAALRRIDRSAPQTELPPTTSAEADPNAPLPVPGALLRGRLDRTHWLTFGYEQPELALVSERLPLRASASGANPVVFAPAARLVISGFTWPDNTQRVYGGGSYATVEALGDGRVVLFAEDPLFRGVFDAPSGLLTNAIFLGSRGR